MSNMTKSSVVPLLQAVFALAREIAELAPGDFKRAVPVAFVVHMLSKPIIFAELLATTANP